MKIIMLGAPGAGKGTQADMICGKYNVPHISTGDIFRANIKNGTELGQKAKGYMDAGELVPDSLVVDLVIDRIHQDDAANGYVHRCKAANIQNNYTSCGTYKHLSTSDSYQHVSA